MQTFHHYLISIIQNFFEKFGIVIHKHYLCNRMYYKSITVYNEPNELTKAAINEATSGKNPNKSYSSVDEMFNDILNNIG